MSTVSIKQLAQFCVEKFQKSIYKDYNYAGTLYVAVYCTNQVECSITPHILDGAMSCFLIHKQKYLYNDRVEYKVDYINENNSVTDGYIGNGFYLRAQTTGQYSLILQKHDPLITYTFNLPFEDKMQKIWDVYCKLKGAKSKEELLLRNKMIKNEDSGIKAELDSAYQLLEELNNKYKKLLDDIRAIVG